MSTLLLQIWGSRELNHTVWPPHLYIYDDLLIYKKRRFFKVNEVTISYSHGVRVNLNKGIFFASLEIVTSADENIIIKFIRRNKAIKAKLIIDHKIYGALAKHRIEKSVTDIQPESSHNFEKSLARLNELLATRKITQKEFKQKKAQLLRKLR
jgi:hypothetical protein